MCKDYFLYLLPLHPTLAEVSRHIFKLVLYDVLVHVYLHRTGNYRVAFGSRVHFKKSIPNYVHESPSIIMGLFANKN